MKYKGFDVVLANPRGGKAGRGRNKTTTLQVREPFNSQGDYLLKKQIRFNVGTEEETKLAMRAAIKKATEFIDELVATKRN